jgi:hypothetical protein
VHTRNLPRSHRHLPPWEGGASKLRLYSAPSSSSVSASSMRAGHRRRCWLSRRGLCRVSHHTDGIKTLRSPCSTTLALALTIWGEARDESSCSRQGGLRSPPVERERRKGGGPPEERVNHRRRKSDGRRGTAGGSPRLGFVFLAAESRPAF